MPQPSRQPSNVPRPRVHEAQEQLAKIFAKQPKQLQYHVLVLDEHGKLSLQSFAKQSEWQGAAADLVPREVSVFPFIGVHVPLSARPAPPLPPLRYLLLPDDPLPLFVLPTELSPDGTGELGQQYAALTMVNDLQGEAVEEAAEVPTEGAASGDVGPSVL